MKDVGRNRRRSSWSFWGVMLATAALALALAGCTGPSGALQAPAGPTDEEVRQAAIDYCQEKYGIEVSLNTNDINDEGLLRPGLATAEQYAGTPVSVSYDGQPFVVDVVDGKGVGDSRQSAQISEALLGYLADGMGLPPAPYGQMTSEPPTWRTFYDGANIAEVAAEASGLEGSLLYEQAPGRPSGLPAPFASAQASTVAAGVDWPAVAVEDSSRWVYQPEDCLPYFGEVVTVRAEGEDPDRSVAVDARSFDRGSLALYDSAAMGREFEEREVSSEAVKGLTGAVTFGPAYRCVDEAAVLPWCNTAPIFFPDQEWERLTAGYADVGYQLVADGSQALAPFKLRGQWTQGSNTSLVGSVDHFGSYWVIGVPPGANMVLYGTPTA